MDVFTDVDLLCDLMEACNKRRVPVYILLDEKNLDYFTEMCSALDIENSHLSVRVDLFTHSAQTRLNVTHDAVSTNRPPYIAAGHVIVFVVFTFGFCLRSRRTRSCFLFFDVANSVLFTLSQSDLEMFQHWSVRGTLRNRT